MIRTAKLSELTRNNSIKKYIFDSIRNVTIYDKYGMPLGKIISVDFNTKTALVDIYDEDPTAFLKASKKFINAKAEHDRPSYWRCTARKAAEDLGYGAEVIQKIKNAKNEDEIEKIMRSARHKNAD